MSTLKSINIIHPSGTTNNLVNDNLGNVTVGNDLTVTGNTNLTTITTPKIIGGNTPSSSLTLQSTSGLGTSDSILFKVGNSGATTAMTISTTGQVTANNFASSNVYGGTGASSTLTLQSTSGAGTADAIQFKVGNAGATTAINVATTGIVSFPTTGATVLPSSTTSDRPASPATGMLRFNTTLSGFEGYNGTTWGSIGGGATGAGGDQIFWNNGQTVTTSYTIPTGYNSGTFGPITVASGVTVTVPAGSTWSIVNG